MSEISWSQPLHFEKDRSCTQAVVEAAECVLYLGRKYQQVTKKDLDGLIVDKRKSTDSKCKYRSKVLGKLLLNCTLIIPIIALIIKALYRCTHDFKLEVQIKIPENKTPENKTPETTSKAEENLISSDTSEQLTGQAPPIPQNPTPPVDLIEIPDDPILLAKELEKISEEILDYSSNKNNEFLRAGNFFKVLHSFVNPSSLYCFQMKTRRVLNQNPQKPKLGGPEIVEHGKSGDHYKNNQFIIHLENYSDWDLFGLIFQQKSSQLAHYYYQAKALDKLDMFLKEINNARGTCIDGIIECTIDWSINNIENIKAQTLDNTINNYFTNSITSLEEFRKLYPKIVRQNPYYLDENENEQELTYEVIENYIVPLNVFLD